MAPEIQNSEFLKRIYKIQNDQYISDGDLLKECLYYIETVNLADDFLEYMDMEVDLLKTAEILKKL